MQKDRIQAIAAVREAARRIGQPTALPVWVALVSQLNSDGWVIVPKD